MYDRSEFLDVIRRTRTSDLRMCSGFQRDLSALLDNELPDEHARRALAHLESCESCSEFFQAIRLQALAHRDMAVPGSLARRLRRMRGQDLFEGMTDSEIVRRLATALYQLGKAYVLLATDGEYLLEVAEEPVEIDAFASQEAAEAFEAARESGACRVSSDLLSRETDENLVRGRTLIQEALRLKPRFAEARLYLGFTCQVRGDAEEAAREYREVFLRTDRLVNRAHAAIQLGLLHGDMNEHRRALRLFRWVLASGLVHRRPEFAFVLYNVAVEHIALGNFQDAVAVLKRLHEGYPEAWSTAKERLRGSPVLVSKLNGDPESRRFLENMEPAIFAA